MELCTDIDVFKIEQEATIFFQKLNAGIRECREGLTTEQKLYVLALVMPALILVYNQAPDFLPKEPELEKAAFILFFSYQLQDYYIIYQSFLKK